jgi:hypothetical protein
MTRRRLLVLVSLGVVTCVGLGPSASGQIEPWQFRTPGDAAYCRFAGDIQCVRTSDGFWIRISGSLTGNVRVTKGVDASLRGLRDRRVRILRFDDAWISSDAAVYTCLSRRAAVVCHEYRGRTFRLGRAGGHRIYRGPPGSIPSFAPFFRTRSGMRCGNASANGGGEPSYMVLGCWRERDGATVQLPHTQQKRRLSLRRNPHAREYRPPGFRVLRPGTTFAWRCQRVGAKYADRCSARGAGTIVFLCQERVVLRCVNRFGRGFLLGARRIEPF